MDRSLLVDSEQVSFSQETSNILTSLAKFKSQVNLRSNNAKSELLVDEPADGASLCSIEEADVRREASSEIDIRKMSDETPLQDLDDRGDEQMINFTDVPNSHDKDT